MSSHNYQNVLTEAERLSPEDQLALIARLAEGLGRSKATAELLPRWEDYAGSAPYPLCGEDAQEWVTRTRQESDEGRGLS
jgi:hypothetical protein